MGKKDTGESGVMLLLVQRTKQKSTFPKLSEKPASPSVHTQEEGDPVSQKEQECFHELLNAEFRLPP